MKLNTISEGSWTLIANFLNSNFNKLSVATSRLGELKLTSFKGAYTSETELKEKPPKSVPGDYAVVSSSPGVLFSVYYTDLNYNWVTDGGLYDPNVILSNYIEMIALSNISQLDEDIKDYNKHKD